MCLKIKQNTPTLVIIADDLTGALDTSIKFSERGAKTIVINASMSDDLSAYINAGFDVLSINTSTRHSMEKEAYRVVHDIVSFLVSHGIEYIYKKTDSVLRGNIAVEVAALKDAAGVPFIPYVPAYPEMKRTVEDGIMYVAGVPLAGTPLADDPFQKIASSNTSDVFSRSQLSVKLSASSSHIPSEGEGEVIIYDGKTKEDLLETAGVLLDSDIHIFCGCAGFADAVARKLYHKTYKAADIGCSPMLVLCGSVNKVSKNQLDYLSSHGYPRIRLEERELLDPDFISSVRGQGIVGTICGEMKKGNVLVIDTLASSKTINSDGFATAEKVAQGLGRLAFECLDKVDYSVFVIGGDTLLCFLKNFGKLEMEPVCEIRKGVVLSYLHHGGKLMTLMSKSGGFGSVELIAELLNERKINKEDMV